MTAKTELTTDQLIASMGKDALREILVTLTAIQCFEISDRAREKGFFRVESLFEDVAAIFENDAGVMREANNVACELDAA